MNTLYLSAMDAATPSVAAELIKNGELVAIPTETVYGLGADGLNPEAVAKIFIAKGRPQDNPLILHIADAKDMEKFCHSIPDTAYALAEKFWPGPLTMVLPAKDIVPKCTTANLPTVAVRCPDNAVTREIIRQAGVPIASYKPAQVKQSVVGYGNATKRQVQDMTKRLLKLDAMPKPDDAADAIALALCHARSSTSLLAQAQQKNGGFI